MSDVRVKLNIGGVRKLLRSNEVQSDLARRATRAAAAAGPDYEAIVKPHRYTARAFVQTKDTDDARRREAEDKNLTRALDAMR